MKSVPALLSALVLLGWSAGADARQLPNRTQVERAVNAWFVCAAGADCGPPLRHRLTRSRCERLPPNAALPGRILCLFSGVRTGGDAPVNRFRNDCVYMMPDRRGGWRVSSIPDADVCE